MKDALSAVGDKLLYYSHTPGKSVQTLLLE